jgi:hypothetical protein
LALFTAEQREMSAQKPWQAIIPVPLGGKRRK